MYRINNFKSFGETCVKANKMFWKKGSENKLYGRS